MKINDIVYRGLSCKELTAGKLRAVVTTEVGPRILFFGINGKDNMLAEFDGDMDKKNVESFVAYGGHRLWSSPEDPVRTYECDSKPVTVEQLEDGISFTSPCDSVSGLQKTMILNLTEEGMDVCHIIENKGQWPIEFACWGLTQMKNGGLVVIPRNAERTGLLPNGNLVLWDYTKLNDKRLYLGEKFITVQADSSASAPIKIGMMNTSGYSAYINGGDMFVKYYFADKDETYPDGGCNCECYSCKDFTEVESVAPLMKVDKGCTANGYEFWTVVENVKMPAADDEKTLAKLTEDLKRTEEDDE